MEKDVMHMILKGYRNGYLKGILIGVILSAFIGVFILDWRLDELADRVDQISHIMGVTSCSTS